MVKVTFNSALAQKEAKKDEPKSSEEALIVPPDAVAVDCKDPGDVVPVGQRRAWCWCMCFGLAFMLAGVILGGAYLYKYFALQPDDVYYCGLKYIKDDVILNEPSADAPAARYQTIEENIKIFEEDAVEFISVPVPEFADSDPANIVHDFNKKLTAYLDLNLDKCYVIPLNTSIVMPPKNLLELLINIKAGTYLPQSYLIHEHMVITDRIENVDNLGFFIYRLCHDKETYKLQRRETIRDRNHQSAGNAIALGRTPTPQFACRRVRFDFSSSLWLGHRREEVFQPHAWTLRESEFSQVPSPVDRAEASHSQVTLEDL